MIRTLIIGVEGGHIDYKTTTVTLTELSVLFLNANSA